MTTISEKHVELNGAIDEAEDALEKAIAARQRFIAARMNELYPALMQYAPDRYPSHLDGWCPDARHSIAIASIMEGTNLRVVYSSLFRGEWDEDTISVPAALFYGEQDCETTFRLEAERLEAEHKAQKEKDQRQADAFERATYERLKKKFGKDSENNVA